MNGAKLATLACLLNVDSRWYGLTVQHVLAEAEESVLSRTESRQPDQPNNLESTESIPAWATTLDRDDFVVDDVEYEIAVNERQEDDFAVARGEIDPRDASPFSNRLKELYDGAKSLGVMQTSLIFPIHELEHKEEPDLDWALVEVTEENKRPNLFHKVDTHDSVFRHLERVALCHPGEEREVLIMCSPLRYLRGTILCGQSVLGGINRSGRASVWNVILSRGDSKLLKFIIYLKYKVS